MQSLTPTERNWAKSNQYWALIFIMILHCICISETWLSSSISNDDIELNNFTLYRKDRDNGTSGYGGVAIYVANYLNSQRRFHLEVNGLEFICTEIKVKVIIFWLENGKI